MRKVVGCGLAVMVVCAGWAHAEGLDEAIERLSRADASVRDLAMNVTMSMNLTKPMPMKMSSTMEMKALREGTKKLSRVAAKMTQEITGMPVPIPGGGKMEVTTLTLYDGEFLWMEMRNSRMPRVIVVKTTPEKALESSGVGGNMGQGTGAAFTSLKDTFEATKKLCTLKLVGRGTVLGRTTTTIEATMKPETLGRLPAQMRGVMPTRTVVDYDDQTGATLATKGYTAAGAQVMTMTATSLTVNQGVDRSLFRYTPPQGAQVQDMTKATPPMPMPPR